MNIRPLGDRVIIKLAEATTKIGAFYIPEAAKEKPMHGEVKAVGEDLNQDMLGKNVVFNKYGPTEVNVDGEDLLIVKAEDIMAVLE